MARLQRRRHSPVLLLASSRSEFDQIPTRQDPRRTHRLPLLRRTQTRAEGVTAKRGRRRLMTMPQTRRRFLTTLSLAGAAGVLRSPPALAAEGLPETTGVRLVRDPGICLAPQYAAEELLRAEGLTDVRYLEAASDADTAQMI